MLISRATTTLLRTVVAAAGFALISACGSSGGDVDLLRVEITPTAGSAPAGTSQKFQATAVYSNNTSRDVSEEVTWVSSTPTVASIDNTAGTRGLAHALSVGSTTISTSYEDQTASVGFTVIDARATTLALTPLVASAPKGLTLQFTATATFTDGTTRAVTADATWASATTAVAAISDTAGTKGLATGVSVGSSQISAAYAGLNANVAFTVTAATVQSVAVTPAALSLPKGVTQQYVATATYSDSTTQNVTTTATWASSAATVASVSDTAGSKGLATANTVGTATLSASFSGVTGSAPVTVTAAALVSIAVTPSASSIAKGLPQTFTATGTYTDGTTQNLSDTVVWSSSTPAVANISNGAGSKGVAQTPAVGTTTITAAQGTISGSTPFTVSAATVVSLDVSPTTPSIPKGSLQAFAVIGHFTDSSTQELTQSATWSSSTTTVADISNATGNKGQALGKNEGVTTITASFGGQNASTTLTVTAATLARIQVTPNSIRLAAGFERQFFATGINSDNSTVDLTTSVTWSTSDTAKATVSNATGSQGLVTAQPAVTGLIDVKATLGSINGSTQLTVTSATLSSVSLTPTAPSIARGTFQQFTATGTFSDSSTQDFTGQASWTSSSVAVATISSEPGTKGKAEGKNTGSTTISATIKGVTGSTTLTVTAATLVSIEVTPANAKLAKGSTLAFTATGVYSDTTKQDITRNVTWASSSTAVATVTNGAPLGTGSYGVATGVTVGNTTISAAVNGSSVTGSTTLTVTAAEVASIAVTPANTSVARGISQQYKATGTYTDGTTADITGSVLWSSDIDTIATVSNESSSKGLASTPGSGTVIITASVTKGSGTSSTTVSGSATLTVTAQVLSSIAVSPSTAAIPKGSNLLFTAEGTYSDGSKAPITMSVTWASSAPAVATVSNASGNQGQATAVGLGTTTISATLNGVTGSATLTVNEAALISIAVTPAAATVPVGYFRQFTATGIYADGSSKDITSQVIWTSFTPTVASVSNASGSAGRVTGVAASSSSVTITATLSSITANAAVTVSNATLSSISLTPANANISGGATLQYIATGSFNDGSALDLTRQVTWASSNSNVAAIDQAGLATAGTALLSTTVISATKSTVVGQTNLSRGL